MPIRSGPWAATRAGWVAGSPRRRRPGPRPQDDVQRELLLHESEFARTEMTGAISAQHTIMTYALVAAAAVFTALITAWTNPPLRVAVLGLAPLFLVFVWFIWYGELVRMARAARFVWELEKMVNAGQPRPCDAACRAAHVSDLCPRDLLRWETWVRGGNRWDHTLHLGPSYVVSSMLLLGMAIASMILALVFLGVEHVPGSVVALVWLATVVFFAALVLGIVSVLKNPLLRRGTAGEPLRQQVP